jgi:phage-related minor tail protein
MQRFNDELVKAQTNAERLAVSQTAFNKLLETGSITQDQYTDLLGFAKQRFSAAGAGADGASESVGGLTDKLNAAMPAWRAFVAQMTQASKAAGATGPEVALISRSLSAAGPLIGGFAAALGAIALAYKQGSEEADAYNRALLMSGNAAGASAGQLADMAAQISNAGGDTQAKAAEALAQLAGTGEVAADKLQQVTQVALDLERYAGQSVEKTVQQFAALGNAPVQASLKLNEQYRHLTLAVYEQIKALEDQGRKDEAAAVAQDAYANAMAGRTAKLEENLGTLERAWDGVWSKAKKAWDAMLGIGREDTDAQKLLELDRFIADYSERKARALANPKSLGVGWTSQADAELTHAQQQAAAIRERILATEASTKAEAEHQEASAAGIRLSQRAAQSASAEAKKKIELAKAQADLNKVLNSPSMTEAEKARAQREYDQHVADINAKRGGGTGPGARVGANAATAQIKANLDQLQATIKQGDAIVVQALKDGEVSIDAAYESRLALLKENSAAQREAIEAELAEVDKALAKAKSGERGALTQKRVKLEAELKLLDSSLQEATRRLGLWKNDQERQLADITAKIRVEVANLTGDFDRKAVEDQLKLQFEGRYQAAGRLDTEEERTAARERLDMLRQAALVQAEFNAKLAEAQRLQSALAVQEQAIQAQRQRGQISQPEADVRFVPCTRSRRRRCKASWANCVPYNPPCRRRRRRSSTG